MLLTIPAFSQRVAMIVKGENYYHLYNSQPWEYNRMPINSMEIVGYASELIIFKKGESYYIFNSVPTLLARVPVAKIGKVIHVFDGPSASDGGFTSLKGNIVYVWNREGTKCKIMKRIL